MKTKSLIILCIIIFIIQMALPITSNAYQLQSRSNSETTMDVTLERDETDRNKINVIAIDTEYKITELKYVNKYIEIENIEYFEQNNTDVKEFDITPSQRIETSFEIEDYGSYTVYAKNEIGARFLSRIKLNNPNDAPKITLIKNEENPLELTIKVTTPELNIVKLKIAKKDSINQEIDFNEEGTNIEFTQSNSVTVEYKDITQEGIYVIYAEDEQGNKATSQIYLINQSTPISANISKIDENRNVKIEITDSLCNIIKIKVAKESEIKNFEDFETKGEEIEITPSKNIDITYQAPEDDIYVFYIEDEAGYKKMIQKRITTQSETIQVEISQNENDPRELLISASDTLSSIIEMKIALGEDIDFEYFETEGEKLEIIPGKNVTATYTLNQNSKVHIFVQDESGYKYIYSTTITGIDIKPIEPPVITLEQNIQKPRQIDVTVLGIDDFIDEVKWTKGSQNAEYFKENGTTIGEGIVGKMVRTNFEIDEVGTYTVYAIDNSGNETVKQIEINSMETPEEPDPNPDEDTQPPEITFSKVIDKENNKVNITANIVDDKSQIEIDAAFEGIESLALIEAKCDLSDDFLVRQLYYPFRLWNGRISKRVRPIFLVYSNSIFSLYEYKFEDPDNYNSLRLVKQKHYSIENTEIEITDIQGICDTVRTIPEPDLPFPQADNFKRVINLCELLFHRDSLTRDDVTENYAFDVRQTNYYTDAARYLGLLEKTEINGKIRYNLTDKGQRILGLGYRERQLEFAKCILSHPVFLETMRCSLDTGELPTKSVIVDIMRRHSLYHINSDTTYRRRASTVRRWIDWIFGLMGNSQ